jgi:hypothetical protein
MATPVMELSPLQKLARDYPPELVQKVKDIVDEDNKLQMTQLATTIREENKKTIDDAIAELKSNMKPPSPEDIQKLLEQELLEFTMKIPLVGDEKETHRTFVIRELPQVIEKKLLRVAKTRLVPLATEISSLTMNLLEGDAAQKIVDLMNAFEPVLDAMADMVVTILDPYEKNKEIDVEWVQNHMTTQKIATVVIAQFECNRLRDFLSLASKGFR